MTDISQQDALALYSPKRSLLETFTKVHKQLACAPLLVIVVVILIISNSNTLLVIVILIIGNTNTNN